VMSPYLKFGNVSIRRLWYDVHDVIDGYKGKDKTAAPENYEGQLLFREMYAVGELALGDEYQQIRGNKISRYMDWYLPNVYDAGGKRITPRPRGDEASEKRLELFVQGRTGFPWIDALIRQLRQTGWIHHLGRHSLAAFLTRGQCWISWERGSELFEQWLLDWDPCSNPGNWMWLSCSAYFSQYFRVYGLASFPAKYDKTGELVRRYCPELKDFPDKYIYAPHTAPIAVQKQANCIIGKDYPHPMVDEKEEKAKCLARCKAAYSAGFYGTSKEVLEGKAEAILRKEHGQPEPEEPDTSQAVSKANKIPDWAKPAVGVKSGPTSKGAKAATDKKKAASKKEGDEDGEEKGEGDEDDDEDQDPHTADHDDEHPKSTGTKSAAGGTKTKRDSKAAEKKGKKEDGDADGDGDDGEISPRRSKRQRTGSSSSKAGK